MDFDIRFDGEESLRKAFRTRVPGLKATFVETGTVFEIKDVSASGFAVQDQHRRFAENEVHDVHVHLGESLFLKSVKAQVMRVLDNGIVGLNFLDLDRRQTMRLDKLVLEVQKRLIAMRKARKKQEAEQDSDSGS